MIQAKPGEVGMRRRELIKLFGGAAVGWPIAAYAQQSTGTRTVAALMNIAEKDPQSLVWASAFERGLRERGWSLGKPNLNLWSISGPPRG